MQSSSASGSPRMSHAEIQDKINGLHVNLNLFAKGVEQFSAEDVKVQLEKYLLKTVGSDIANLVFAYVSQENLLTTERDTNWTPEVRFDFSGSF